MIDTIREMTATMKAEIKGPRKRGIPSNSILLCEGRFTASQKGFCYAIMVRDR